MPFDISGNYSRVHNWQEDRDNGIRILAQRMDEEDDSIAGALNQAFLRTGVVPMTGPLMMNGQHVSQVAAGTALQPGLTFELDPDTGYFQPGIGQLGVSINGVQIGLWSDTGLNVKGISITGGGTIGDNIDIPGYIQAGGDLSIAGTSNLAGPTKLGFTHITGINNDPAMVELGADRTGDGVAIIDLHSTAGSDYDARILKSAGAAGAFILATKGASSLILNSEDIGGNVIIQTLGQNRLGIWDTGDAQFYHNVAVAGSFSAVGNIVAAGSLRAPFFEMPVAGVVNGLVYADGGNPGAVNISTNRQSPGNERYFIFQNDGQLNIKGGIAWHSANDGINSGLDADLLQGVGGGAYARKDTGDTQAFNGAITSGYIRSYGSGQVDSSFHIGAAGAMYLHDDGNNRFIRLTNPWTIGYNVPSNFMFFSTNAGTALQINGDNFVICYGNMQANGTIRSGSSMYANGSITAEGSSAMVSWQMRDNAGITNGWYGTEGFSRYWRSDLGDKFQIHATAFRHTTDVGADCGGPGFRWATVWCQSSTMATSDAREKDWRGGLNAIELAASKDLSKEIGIYRWLRDVEKDGDAAKLQCGVVAQKVIEVFAAHGLDALDYGFITHQEWEESTHNGPQVLDEEGNPLFDENGGPVVTEVLHPAGDRYSVMYPDLCMFMMAAQEQRLAALEALVNP